MKDWRDKEKEIVVSRPILDINECEYIDPAILFKEST